MGEFGDAMVHRFLQALLPFDGNLKGSLRRP